MTDQQPMYSQRCARCGYARINVRHETDREHSPEGLAYFADADVPFCEFQAVTDPMLDHMGHRSEERAVTDPKPLAADGEAALRDHLSRAIDGDSYTPHLVARLLATLDAERAARDGGMDAVRGAIGALHSAVESGEPCSALLHRVYTEGVAACAALASPAPAPALDATRKENAMTLTIGSVVVIDGWKYEVNREPGDDSPAHLTLVETDRPLTAPAPALDRERLARALHGLWRTFWSESKGVGWHYKMWADEDVFPHFDDGTLADAIADAYEREDGA